MKRWMPAFQLLGVGWYIALCIVLGVWLGLWIDRRFGTGIIFTLAGLGLGLIVAIYGTYEMLIPILRNRRDNKEEHN